MSDNLSKTVHGDFDAVFCEVTQSSPVSWITQGELRLFHLNIRNNKFNPEEMKKLLYRNIGDYVFSCAKIEHFKVNGDAYAIVSQALRVLRKNGGADIKGTGSELGELLLYSFLEEKLKAPKLMSRVELSTDAKQYASSCDGIHLLTSGVSGVPYHQVVFGASSIVGDLTYAIDAAFESIVEIEKNEDKELHMVDNVIFDRLLNDDEVELAKQIFIPSPNPMVNYNTSYGIFLGYTIGLDPNQYSIAEFPGIVEEKMQEDIRRNIDYILQKISDNNLNLHSFYSYLNELHENILFNYALKLFQIQGGKREYNLKDALRFADLLSKSTHPTNSDSHKMWTQELIILLNELHPEDALVKLYAGSVFSSAGNHQGLQIINSEYQDINVFEKIFEQFRNDYLTIPAAPEMKFFSAQKEAYDHLTDPCFSYSGPTSMGKSFIMRMFIKDEILHGAKKNYALIVPTKALINEVRSKIINDLEDNLKRCNYRVVTAASDIALEENHNFIFVFTPERLLYLLISNPLLEVDYLFVDEAHKLSGKNSRGPFYYKVVNMLLQKEKKPHFIFASPNIPNPQVYLRLMNEAIESSDESKLATTYSPVVQIKFLMDLINNNISAYNERTNHCIQIASIKKSDVNLNDMLLLFEGKNLRLPPEKRSQTIVYYNGRAKAIAAARNFAESRGILDKNDPELDSLSKDIMQEVHGDYYLASMIKKGVAYHIGYLPASIRTRIEDLFQKGNITIMFCTSTLLEGVNLPADNLFITDNKIFRRKMNPVDFRNLIGRVGRISYNLYGNVFFVSDEKSVSSESYIEMLQGPIPEHRNVVFADTLEAIENIVLFSISNYFLRFSNEYKKIHGVDEFDNNWYEYVEFGTTDELRLRLSLLDCGNTSVMTEAASIRFNAPKLFLEEDA